MIDNAQNVTLAATNTYLTAANNFVQGNGKRHIDATTGAPDGLALNAVPVDIDPTMTTAQVAAAIGNAIDQRFSGNRNIVAAAGTQIVNGSQFSLTDAYQTVTFTFWDGSGTQPANAVTYNPTDSNAGDTAAAIVTPSPRPRLEST